MNNLLSFLKNRDKKLTDTEKWEKSLEEAEKLHGFTKAPEPITGTFPDISASPFVLARRFGHVFKQIKQGVHNRPLDFLLSKYGKSNHARVRALIEENKAIAMDSPERSMPLQKAINKMIKIIEPDKKKQRNILNKWHEEEYGDFIEPLKKRLLELL